MEAKEKAEFLMKKTICLINSWNYSWAEDKNMDEIKKDGENPKSWHRAKETTLFYIDEIISSVQKFNTGVISDKWSFWNEVRKEVENL